MQFTIRTLLFLFFPAALIGYLLKPGHLLRGNVLLEFRCIMCEEGKLRLMSDNVIRKTMKSADVEITNNSGNTLWFDGAEPGSPQTIYVESLVDDQWVSMGIFIEGGHNIAFHDGETFLIAVPVYEEANVFRVGIIVSSCWFGARSFVWSDGLKFKLPESPGDAGGPGS